MQINRSRGAVATLNYWQPAIANQQFDLSQTKFSHPLVLPPEQCN